MHAGAAPGAGAEDARTDTTTDAHNPPAGSERAAERIDAASADAAAEQGSQPVLDAHRDRHSTGAGTSAAMLQQARAAEASEDAETAAAVQAAEVAAAIATLEDDVELQGGDKHTDSEDESDGELDLDAIITAGGVFSCLHLLQLCCQLLHLFTAKPLARAHVNASSESLHFHLI